MSKYRERGAYHYDEFNRPTIYQSHVLNLLERVKRTVLGGPQGLEVLDIGCGEGLIMSELTKLGFKCTGLEIDEDAVKLGRERGNNIVWNEMAMESSLKANSFDVVMLCDVLEHVKTYSAMIANAQRIAPLIFIALPDRDDPHAHKPQINVGDVVDCFRGWVIQFADQRYARWLMAFSDPRAR